jgi:hypothetical protein
MIGGSDLRHLERLPPQARERLLLLDGVAQDALAASQGAQARLNEITRRAGGRGQDASADPNVPRLGRIVEGARQQYETLFSLAGAILSWLRTLPVGAALEAVAAEAPGRTEGESFEQAIGRTRNDLGLLAAERARVAAAPQPKAALKAQVRPFVADLIYRAEPRLRLERGKPFEAVFLDRQRDLGLSESFTAADGLPEPFVGLRDANSDAMVRSGGAGGADRRALVAGRGGADRHGDRSAGDADMGPPAGVRPPRGHGQASRRVVGRALFEPAADRLA